MSFRDWKFFKPDEFIRSETADRLNIVNQPTEQDQESLDLLVIHVLDPLREKLDVPLIVTSGFRSIQLNQALGGSFASDHMYGRAADIIAIGKTPEQVFKTLYRFELPYIQQVILEFGKWVHIAIDTKYFYDDPPKKEYLIADYNHKGKVFYETFYG